MKPVAWSWRNALFGLLIASVPLLIIPVGHVETGLALLFGTLPAAIIGLLPTRQSRLQLVVIGTLFGLSMVLGSFVAQWPLLAVISIFFAALGASLLATRTAIGTLATTLCIPLMGIGFSYVGLASSLDIALLIIGGSFVAYLWSLLFREYEQGEHEKAGLMKTAAARSYGIRLGLAGATAAGIGFGFGADHIGWIVGAALLVMRPEAEMQQLRSVGRVVSVLTGALLASWLLTKTLDPVIVALLAGVALVMAAATSKSHWYLTPAFTTFLVFWVLLYGNATADNIAYRFNERVLETILGVAIAYVFGLLAPKVMQMARAQL